MTIQFDDICLEIDGKKLFDRLNWEIDSDGCWALTGPEGSGKTMLLRILLGLSKPTSGKVRLLGDYKYDRVNAGVVFQDDLLLETFTAAENVALVYSRLSVARAREELSRFFLSEKTDALVSELSPVERRLVCITRACIVPSDILIMDEPFRGMDFALRERCIRLIRDIAGHKAIVFAQRTPEGLEFCRNFPL